MEAGVFLVAQVAYPGLDLKIYRSQLDALAQEIQPDVASATGLHDQMVILSRALFGSGRFRGNWKYYFDPENSYLNRVLDRKLGIPISLSILVLLIGRRLKLALDGVGVPGHFMVKSQEGKDSIYLDPFNQGRFLTRAECVQFIVEAGYPYQPATLEGLSVKEILARLLRNLILIYVDQGEMKKEETLRQFLDALVPLGKREMNQGENH